MLATRPRVLTLAISLALTAGFWSAIAAETTTQAIQGKVVSVADGDTITILDSAKRPTVIRLDGIDAPEGHQEFGARSKQALSEKVFGKDVEVKWREKDKYGRTLGHVYVDGRWINKEMIWDGLAWHFKKYNRMPDLAKAEVVARDAKSGLWAFENPIAPWDFRHPKEAVVTVEPTTALSVAAAPAPAPTEAESALSVALSQLPTGKPSGARMSIASGRFAEEKPAAQAMVYITKTGAKYHRAGCRHLRKSSIPISLSDAQSGYSPCSVCRP